MNQRETKLMHLTVATIQEMDAFAVWQSVELMDAADSQKENRRREAIKSCGKQ